MSMPDHQFLCSIAGSDPTGGAGLQADLKTFAAHGIAGTAIVTAVTVQDRDEVQRVDPVPASLVAEQIAALRRATAPSGIKTGMLWSAEIIQAVLAALEDWEGLLVVDPVLMATSGGSLLHAEALPALRDALLPRASVLTPNLPEAAALLAVPEILPGEEADAARALLALGPSAVLLKGGHRTSTEAVDTLAFGDEVESLVLPRIPDVSGHGTGCTLASALVARLVAGEGPRDAAWGAKRYVHRALASSRAKGDGWLLDHTVSTS